MKLKGWIAVEDNCLWVACQSKTILDDILDSFVADSGNPFKGKIKKCSLTIPDSEASDA